MPDQCQVTGFAGVEQQFRKCIISTSIDNTHPYGYETNKRHLN